MEEYTQKKSPKVLLKNVEVDGAVVDVLFDERITEIGKIGTWAGVETRDAAGQLLLPGLTDHHLHLRAYGAVASSIPVGPDEIADLATLLTVLEAEPGNDWVRCIGYHESTLGELNRDDLNTLDRPVRIQHRSGKVWVLNTPALEQLEVAAADHPGVERDARGRPTGRLFRMDDWLRERLRTAPGARESTLEVVRDTLAGFGITGMTDTSHTNRAHDQRCLEDEMHPLTLKCMGEDVEGPLKVMLDEDALPDLDSLIRRIERAHQDDRGVAFHCVSRLELVLALSALTTSGVHSEDRIEHGGIVPVEAFDDLLRLALPVVTQPGFIYARGDQYLAQVEPAELKNLYRYASLAAAGIPVVASSDAPYGPVDPWQVMHSAVTRCTRGGQVIGAEECVTPEEALRGYLRPTPKSTPRKIAAGQVADLCLLDRSWRKARENLSQVKIEQTWVKGGPLVSK